VNFLLCPFSDTKLTQTLDFYLGTQPVEVEGDLDTLFLHHDLRMHCAGRG